MTNKALDTLAYRGYLIHYGIAGTVTNVSKNGHHICFARTLVEARRVIDTLQ
jgi:L-lactate utilization protein LutB